MFPSPSSPGDPLVVRLVRQFKYDLLIQERAQMVSMAQRWRNMEISLLGNIQALAEEASQLAAAGQSLSISKVVQLERYRAFLAQAREEMRRYEDYAEGFITGQQRAWGLQGVDNAINAVRAVYAEAGRVYTAFDRLPVGAIEAMVGLAGDGSPLRTLLQASFGDSTDGLLSALIGSTTMGRNPRETARAMAEGWGVGLNRSLNIARTEQLRAYRESNRLQYQATGLVRGYKRIATHDDRVCLGCLFSEGWEYELEQHFEEHPQGRCSLIPLVIGFQTPSWQQGAIWFNTLSADQQERIMGTGHYAAWKDGAFSLDQLVTRKVDAVWGGSLVPTPLSKLVEQ